MEITATGLIEVVDVVEFAGDVVELLTTAATVVSVIPVVFVKPIVTVLVEAVALVNVYAVPTEALENVKLDETFEMPCVES